MVGLVGCWNGWMDLLGMDGWVGMEQAIGMVGPEVGWLGLMGSWMHQVGSCMGIYVLGHGVEGTVVLHMGR